MYIVSCGLNFFISFIFFLYSYICWEHPQNYVKESEYSDFLFLSQSSVQSLPADWPTSKNLVNEISATYILHLRHKNQIQVDNNCYLPEVSLCRILSWIFSLWNFHLEFQILIIFIFYFNIGQFKPVSCQIVVSPAKTKFFLYWKSWNYLSYIL